MQCISNFHLRSRYALWGDKRYHQDKSKTHHKGIPEKRARTMISHGGMRKNATLRLSLTSWDCHLSGSIRSLAFR